MSILFETPAAEPGWLKLIPVLSAVIAVLGGVFMFYLNKWWESRQNKKKREDEDDEVHTSAIVKLSELSKAEREQLRQETKALHEKEINFYKQQIEHKDVQIAFKDDEIRVAKRGELVARQKAHNYANIINNLQLFIIMVKTVADKFDLEFPSPELYGVDKDLIKSEEKELRLLTEAIEILDNNSKDRNDRKDSDNDFIS